MTARHFSTCAAIGTAMAVLLAAPAWADAQAASHGGHQANAGSPEDQAARVVHSVAAVDPALAAELEAIRAATAKYLDVEVAVAEGYLRDPADMCVTAGMEGLPRQLGNMGIHYFRPDLLGLTGVEPRVSGMGTHTDFRQPAILIYEPQPDGALELVAVENLVFAAGWEAAGRSGVPEFRGNEYYHMINNPLTGADEAHGFEPHYELHLWLYRENPSGVFAQFNPNVTCRHHGGGHGHGQDRQYEE
jgi:hypothetical protein